VTAGLAGQPEPAAVSRPQSATGGSSSTAQEARLFFAMAVTCVVIAFVGFAPTFWRPLAQGTFHANPIVYVHGTLFFSWTILLAVQGWLVLRRQLDSHRTIGTVGIAIATLVATSGLLVLMNVVATAQPLGLLETAAPDLIFPVVGFPTFALLVAMAFMNVRRADYHKRYMLLATISALDAPVVRWVLFEGHTSAGYAEGMVASLVFEVMVGALVFFDLRLRGRIHPAYFVGGAILVAGQVLRGLLGPSAWWASSIQWLPKLLGQ
jgi:uncharacterized membrane protein YozB (DUF420 family)